MTHVVRRVSIGLVVAVFCGLLVTSMPAGAQSVTPCLGGDGSSQVDQFGPYGIGESEVVELESDVDGSIIQIGFIRPEAPSGYRSPVIVRASPYIYNDLRDVELRDCNPFLVDNFVPHGYAVAFVPTRGAGGTDSCADLMGPKERSDLDQAVTWLGTQAWSNGRVGMTGASYDGSTPWEVASMGNPHLKTIVPVSGVHSLFDLIYQRGRNDWRWWFFVSGYYHYYGLGFANPLFGRDPDRWLNSAACDTTIEGLGATFETYLTGDYDGYDYWKKRHMDPDILEKYEGSVLLVQGLQDWNVDPGHQYPFVNRLERRGVYVEHLLGQWDHAYPDSAHEAGPRGDYAEILLAWWDRWLKGDRSADLGARVEVQDSDLQWRTEKAWPPADSRSDTFYLSADDSLSESPSKEEATALLGPGTRNRHFFLSDNTTVWNDLPPDHYCADCAMFVREVTEDLRIVGLPELKLTVTPTGPGGFVAAYLIRIADDGEWHLLGWGANDLRFPGGGRGPEEVEAGQETTMRFSLQPLDAVVHDGEQLLLLLDQGHADHMPSVPFFPVELRYGGKLSTFGFQTTRPSAGDFFDPPTVGG